MGWGSRSGLLLLAFGTPISVFLARTTHLDLDDRGPMYYFWAICYMAGYVGGW